MEISEKEAKKLMRKNVRRYREWEDSPEGIHYRLSYRPGGCGNADLLLTEALHKIPRRIRDRVLEKVTFIMATGEDGAYWDTLCTPHDKDKIGHFIFINLTGRRSKKYQLTTIAHEIAHFILHQPNGGRKAEMAADDLCETWGFGRAYKSYDHFPV